MLLFIIFCCSIVLRCFQMRRHLKTMEALLPFNCDATSSRFSSEWKRIYFYMDMDELYFHIMEKLYVLRMERIYFLRMEKLYFIRMAKKIFLDMEKLNFNIMEKLCFLIMEKKILKRNKWNFNWCNTFPSCTASAWRNQRTMNFW